VIVLYLYLSPATSPGADWCFWHARSIAEPCHASAGMLYGSAVLLTVSLSGCIWNGQEPC